MRVQVGWREGGQHAPGQGVGRKGWHARTRRQAAAITTGSVVQYRLAPEAARAQLPACNASPIPLRCHTQIRFWAPQPPSYAHTPTRTQARVHTHSHGARADTLARLLTDSLARSLLTHSLTNSLTHSPRTHPHTFAYTQHNAPQRTPAGAAPRTRAPHLRVRRPELCRHVLVQCVRLGRLVPHPVLLERHGGASPHRGRHALADLVRGAGALRSHGLGPPARAEQGEGVGGQRQGRRRRGWWLAGGEGGRAGCHRGPNSSGRRSIHAQGSRGAGRLRSPCRGDRGGWHADRRGACRRCRGLGRHRCRRQRRAGRHWFLGHLPAGLAAASSRHLSTTDAHRCRLCVAHRQGKGRTDHSGRWRR